MTGVDKDLATLREQLEKPWCPNLGSCPPEMHSGCSYCAAHDDAVSALARVEAELSRLRDQRDEAEASAVTWQDSSGAYYQRMVAAEAELSRLRAERDAERERFHRHIEDMIEPKLLARAVAAEARCARLQQALGESLLSIEEYAEVSGVLIADPEKLRALAGPDTPADKPLAPAAATTPTQSGGVPEGNDGAAGAKGPLCIRCWNELDNGIAVDTPADSQEDKT